MARIVIAAGVLLASFAVASLLASGTEGATEALYVFGDSYVDTGNSDSDSLAWHCPYGSTWPRQPAGRFSDGLVLTDNIGCYLGVESPIPFQKIRTSSGDGNKINCSSQGINFAVGGSGTFATHNVSTQIKDLKIAIGLGCVPVEKRSNSIVLYAVNGNDYVAFLKEHQKDLLLLWETSQFIQKVVDEIVVDIRHLLSFGFTKFYITNMGPVNLYPLASLFPQFIQDLGGLIVNTHNFLLNNKISNLEAEFTNSNFFIIDLHKAFTKILEGGSIVPLLPGPCLKDLQNKDCLKPCSNVNQMLFWDYFHPTQAGWSKIVDLALPNFSGCDPLQPAFATI